MHTKGKKYDPRGVAIVKNSMIELNKIILDSLLKNKLNPYCLPPTDFMTGNKPITKKVKEIEKIAKSGLIPVTYGDALWYGQNKTYILSGDKIMTHLAKILKPRLCIFALNEDGLYSDLKTKKLIYELDGERPSISENKMDVTGGMARKVEEASIAKRFGPDVLADFMIDFMKRKKDGPFLVYYPALLVHTPYIRVPGGQTTSALPDSEQKNGPECFPEMVEYLDKNVGRLVNAVDELGISNNTIILFCADNGTHGLVTSIWGENRTRIKGGKMTMTDRGSRVPLIVSWPQTIKPGTRCDDLVELADFLPTFLEIASAPKPVQRVHGQSFFPQLRGNKQPSRQWVHIEYKNNEQIRTREWIYTRKGKLTRVNELGRPENRPERQGDHAVVRNEMKRIFALIDGDAVERSSQSER